jgi:hypothetical protein
MSLGVNNLLMLILSGLMIDLLLDATSWIKTKLRLVNF